MFQLYSCAYNKAHKLNVEHDGTRCEVVKMMLVVPRTCSYGVRGIESRIQSGIWNPSRVPIPMFDVPRSSAQSSRQYFSTADQIKYEKQENLTEKFVLE